MRYKILIFSITFSLLSLFSCKQNQWDGDIDTISYKLEAKDIDALFLDRSLEEVNTAHQNAAINCTELYEMELSFNLRAPIDTNLSKLIYSFYSSDYIRKIELQKQEKFTDRKTWVKNIEDGFKHLMLHFPDQKYPVELLWINNLFAGVHSSDSAISVGLEYYLGAENKVVKSIPTEELYAWQRKRMDASYLERDIIESWVQAHFVPQLDGNLAEHIVQAGKTLLLVRAAFPDFEEKTILKYDASELKYAKEKVSLVWEYLIEQKLLFQNNPRDKSNFLNAGPFTAGLSDDAPDRLGQYLGFMMVTGYMNKNEISLQTLLQTDYNKILQAFELD